MEYLLHLDREVFLYLNNLGTPTWDWFWIFITNKWASIPLYAFLIFLLYKKIGIRATVLALVLIAGMITCTDQLANVFKDGFMRLRPCNLDLDARFLMSYCGGYGFFSAHACSSMALAIFVGSILKRYYKYAMPGLLFWSFILGYSRIYVGKHYPGDVLVGFIIGAIIGALFYQLIKRIVRHYKTPLKYSFTEV